MIPPMTLHDGECSDCLKVGNLIAVELGQVISTLLPRLFCTIHIRSDIFEIKSSLHYSLHTRMARITWLLLLCLPLYVQTDNTKLRSFDTSPVLHYLLNRRGGAFSPTIFVEDNVNFTHLEYELARAESRYNLTKREVKGNRLVRKPKSVGGSGSNVEGQLLGDLALDGAW